MQDSKLTPAGSVVKFLAWFTFVPMIIAHFAGYDLAVNILFFIWVSAGVLTWIARI